jgi:hypothetical protein
MGKKGGSHLFSLHLPPLTAEDFGITDDMRDPEIKAQAKAAARGEKPEHLREREPAW